MHFRTGLTCFFSALCVTVSVPMAAPAAVQETSAVAVPFNPPVDQPVRYRLRTTENGEDRKSEISSVETMTFQPRKDGYRVSVTSSDVTLADPSLPPAMIGQMLELAKLPYAIRVSENAEIVDFENGKALWKKAMDILETGLRERAAADKNDNVAEEMKELVGFYRNMSKEERLAQMTQSLEPIFQFAQTEWSEPVESEFETETPFGPMTQRFRMELTGVSGDVASFKIRGIIPGSELNEYISRMIAEMAPDADAATKAEFKKIKMELVDVGTAQVSMTDGLLLRYENKRTADVLAGGKKMKMVETSTVERLR